MKKIYLVSDDHYQCYHENWKSYGKDRELNTLGCALIAVDLRKEGFRDFIADETVDQEALDLCCCNGPEMEVSITKNNNEFTLQVSDEWFPAIKIAQDDFIKLTEEFLHIAKIGPDVIELIQNDNGSFTFMYEK